MFLDIGEVMKTRKMRLLNYIWIMFLKNRLNTKLWKNV